MNLTLTMVDTETGEILARNNKNLTFNFNTKTDAGFRTCLEWCMSAVRGVRNTEHKNIEVRFHFAEDKQIPWISEEFAKLAKDLSLEYVR